MDWQRVTALIDLSSQVSSISSGFCELLTLEVHLLGQLLELQGTEGSANLYLAYVEVNLQIPGIKGYNENVLLLVILTTTYSKRVLVLVGSNIIDWAMGMMSKGEPVRATVTWKQAHFSVVMSRSLQLPWTDSEGDKGVGRKVTPSPSTILQCPGFCLDEVQGPVCTTQKVVAIPPFGPVSIHGNMGVWGHCKWVHVLAEPAQGPQLPASMVPTATYGELHPGSS